METLSVAAHLFLVLQLTAQ